MSYVTCSMQQSARRPKASPGEGRPRPGAARARSGRGGGSRAAPGAVPALAVVSTTLREQVYQTLRRGIATGEIASGTRLVASQLAERWGVSRTPVNEALHLLENEGLITRLATGVCEVVGLSDERIDELYTVRAMLEGLCAQKAAERAKPRTVRELERIMREIARATERADWATVDMLGKEFHLAIQAASGLHQVPAMLRALEGLIDRYRARTIARPGRPPRAYEEHMAILAAIREGDGERAETAMRGHILSAWRSAKGEAT
ncbi:MAG: GntR family transcriptional regulator [Clostridia bacterium]|nr:GntR family transcriptional regulator [Clostridia bacterium]